MKFCNPFHHKAPNPHVEQTITQWLKKSDTGQYYEVPFISLDRLYHLAKLMKNEVTLLYQKQTSSLQLSEKIRLSAMNLNGSYQFANEQINMLSDFQKDNTRQLIKLNSGLWVSMTMDCYRTIWETKLTAFDAQTKRKSIGSLLLGDIKKLKDQEHYTNHYIHDGMKYFLFDHVLHELLRENLADFCLEYGAYHDFATFTFCDYVLSVFNDSTYDWLEKVIGRASEASDTSLLWSKK